jgi:hypothetical protein
MTSQNFSSPCVCFEAQTGKHLLGLNLTAFDPKPEVAPAKQFEHETPRAAQWF